MRERSVTGHLQAEHSRNRKKEHTCKEAGYKEDTSRGYREEQAVQEWNATCKDDPKVRMRMTGCGRGLQLRRKAWEGHWPMQ